MSAENTTPALTDAGNVVELHPTGAPADNAPQSIPAPPLPPLDDVRTSSAELPARARSFLAHAKKWLASNWFAMVAAWPVLAVLMAPYGAAILAAKHHAWVWDTAHSHQRRAWRENAKGTSEDKRVRSDYVDMIRRRWAWTSGFGLAVVAGAVLVANLAPAWQAWTALAVLWGAVGGYGIAKAPWIRRPGRKVDHTPRISVPFLARALDACGFPPEKSKRGHVGTEVLWVQSVKGGMEAAINLAPGIEVEKITSEKTRGALAGALRRPKACVWPTADDNEHAGRVSLYISDKPLRDRPPVRWKLARTGATNVFEPQPIGEDLYGKEVTAKLIGRSVLIGGQTGMGKSAALDIISMILALDPRTEIHAFDFKGNGDLDCLEPIAHAFRAGGSPDDMEFFLRDLEYAQDERAKRAQKIRELKKSLGLTSSAVTDEIASQKGMHPIVFVIDEAHIPFDKDITPLAKEIKSAVEDLVRRGRTAGVFVVLATQELNGESIPTPIARNCSYRWCLKVADPTASNTALGGGYAGKGFDASAFSIADKGLAYFRGETSNPLMMRGAYVDEPAKARVIERAYIARRDAGWLSGMAAGEIPADEDRGNVLDHLVAVWPDDAKRVRSEDLVPLLASRFSEYAEHTVPALNAAVRAHGVSTVQVGKRENGKTTNRDGFTYADIRAARGGES